MSGSFRIGKILGIPILVNYSWFIVFGLITWTLYSYYFPSRYPHLSSTTHLFMGVFASLLLFSSIIFHELAHCFIAQKNKLYVGCITLFVFGGVAQLKSEPSSPQVELKMAIAGPLSSLLLCILFGTAWLITMSHYEALGAIFQYILLINIILIIFNMLPAYPLDGGRVLRATIWYFNQNIKKATKYAAVVGQGFAFLFILWGFTLIFYNSRLVDGIWLIFLGWFLDQAAVSSYQQIILRKVLGDYLVKDIMTTDVRVIYPFMSLEKAANLFLLYKHGGFPVVEGENIIGMLTLHDLKKVPQDLWTIKLVRDAMTSADKLHFISPYDSALEAIIQMNRQKIGRMPVVEEGNLVGIITRSDLTQVLQLYSG